MTASQPFEFFQRDRSQQPPAFTPDYKSTTLRSPRLALWSLQNSLSEVTGPVFGHEELGPLDGDLILNCAKDGEPIGERTIVHGRVLDENGRGVPGTRWSRCGRPTPAGDTGTVNDTYHGARGPQLRRLRAGGDGRGRLTTPSAP